MGTAAGMSKRTHAQWVELRRRDAVERRKITCQACGSVFHRSRPLKIPKLGNYCSEKTRIESRLFKGGMLGFIRAMISIGYPDKILHKAMVNGGLSWA